MERESADKFVMDSRANDTSVAPFARLVIRGPDGSTVTKDVLRPTTLLGSLGPCNIQLIGPKVGPAHCVFVVESSGLRVHDLRVPTGTWLNGQRINAASLADGDIVRVDEFDCRVETNLPSQQDSTDFSTGSARLVIAGRDGRSVAKDVFRPTTLGGSRAGCNIQLGGADVAAAHFLITVFSGRMRIRDLRTRFGTRVNGRAVSVWTLRDGDEIDFGSFRAQLETSLQCHTESVDDQIDSRFGPSVAVLNQESARLAQERAELSDSRQAIDIEWANLDRLRDELYQSQRRLAAESETLAATRLDFEQVESKFEQTRIQLDRDKADLANKRASVDTDRNAVRQATEALATGEKELVAVLAALAAERTALASAHEKLDAVQKSLGLERAELEANQESLQASRATLDNDRSAIESAEERLDARERQFTASKEELDRRSARLDEREAERRAAESRHIVAEEAIRQREDECRQREAALDSGSAGLASEAERIQQHTEAVARERGALDRDREALSAARGRFDTERTELQLQIEADRAALADRKHELESERKDIASQRAALQREREALDNTAKKQRRTDMRLTQREEEIAAQSVSLDVRRDAQVHRDVEMAGRQQEIEAVQCSLTELRRALEDERLQLERDRIALEQDVARFKAEAGTLQVDLAALAHDRDDLAGRECALDEARKVLELERAALAVGQSRLSQESAAHAVAGQAHEAERAALAGDRGRLNLEFAALAARALDVEQHANKLLAREAEQSALDAELAERSRLLAVDEARLKQSAQEVAARVERLQWQELASAESRQEHDAKLDLLNIRLRDLEKTEFKLGRSLAALGQEHLRLDAQSREAERRQARLEEENGALRAAEVQIAQLRDAVESDRARLAEQQARFAAGQESLAASKQELEHERRRLEGLGGEVEKNRLRLGDERATIEALQQDLDERSQCVSQSEADLSAQQIELAAEHERIESDRERLEAWSGRLREEQTFARAAKRQFQTTLDEFRSEKRRFQMAIIAIRADRERHRRRRVGAKQIAEDRALASLLHAEGILDDSQAAWFAFDRFGPSQTGRFKLNEFLALGAQSWICEAQDTETNQCVALKILNRPQALDAAAQSRLKAEARLGQAVDHPNVVRTLSCSLPEDHAAYLVMELVQGITLGELIFLHRALPWREACNYAFQASVGLHRLHDAGIVHRDVQPANLLIERDGGLKVADFGLADAPFLRGDKTRGSLSPWAACYAAPELLDGNRLGEPRSDIFSLGCTIYHALSGSPPFSEGNRGKGLRESRSVPPAPLRTFVSDAPLEVIRIVKKMMALDQRDRFTSMNEVTRALAPWARRQTAYFDRQAVLAQRALDARAHLRAAVHQIAERQRSHEAAIAPDR